MIRHIVMFTPKDGQATADLAGVMDGLAGLVGDIAGYTGFEHGPNRDFEGRSAGYSHGFVGTFEDAQALARYADDPRHQALGAALVELCQDGLDGLMVIDIEVAG